MKTAVFPTARHGRVRRRTIRRRVSFLCLLLGLELLLFAAGLTVGWCSASVYHGSAVKQAGTTPGVDVSIRQAGQGSGGWELLLANGENPLPEGFGVPELTEVGNGFSVDSRIYPSLRQMLDDCRAQGLDPLICSAYRSREKQTELFERKVQEYLPGAADRQEAEEQAAAWVNRPGTSEHQTGMALDIVDRSYQLLDRKQEETAVQQWLLANCADYGFILRYPADKEAVTGVSYEPWHYRYVGTEAAREIMDGGLCLEEYLAG